MADATRTEVVLVIRGHVRQAGVAWSSGLRESLSHDAMRVASLWPADQALPADTSMKTAQSAGLSPYIAFDRASGVPYYTQIYDGYRMAILSGRLGPGQRLPSTRTLAAELQISRLPVLNAFEQLLHEGYLEGKVGSGTYVRDCIPDEVARPMRLRRPVEPPQPVRRTAPPPPGVYGAYRDQGAGMFRSIPALDRFPHETFARLTRRHAARLSPSALAYGDPAGYAPLREAIAAYLRTARAVDCDAGQVIILSGSQMGLRVAAMTVTDADSIVCMEEPGYRGARHALGTSAANVVPVPIDNEGIDVGSINRLGPRAQLTYVTPSHQYPLGVSMAVTRRLELLGWAERNNGWILEDDYDSEYRYSSRPLGALQGMDTSGRVIYIGTFSKVLFPAIRLGYAVVPHEMVLRFVRMRETFDLFSPMLYQLVLTDFLREGHFARHLRRMRAIYLARRDAMIAAIEEHASDVLTVGNTDAGLHLVAFLPDGTDDRAVVRAAAEEAMYPSALSTCYANGAPRPGLILGFGGADEAALTSAIRHLGGVIRDTI
jgi:GntR family transcriptional regulator/MocR family aminotransferase